MASVDHTDLIYYSLVTTLGNKDLGFVSPYGRSIPYMKVSLYKGFYYNHMLFYVNRATTYD